MHERAFEGVVVQKLKETRLMDVLELYKESR